MTLTPFTLPDCIEKKLLEFMRIMGLTMGMIDMIVTPDGDYVFLEVNEQGQFLWLEQMNPNLRLLQPCAEFLASGERGYRCKAGERVVVRYEDYLASEEYSTLAEELRQIGPPQSPWVISEHSEPDEREGLGQDPASATSESGAG